MSEPGDSAHSDVHSFFVRIWVDARNDELSWTGRVKSMLDGAERQVRTFDEIETFMLGHLRRGVSG